MHHQYSITAQQRRDLQEPPIVAELKAIFDALPDSDLISQLSRPRGRGRPSYDPSVMWRCFVAYYALNIESVSALIRYLRNNPYVAAACGIDSPAAMPSQPTFSRFGTRLAKRRTLVAVRNVQRELTRGLYALLPDFGRTLAIDSSHMKGWSNGRRKGRKGTSPTRRQRPRIGKLSDPDAGWCVKKNSQGNKHYVWGYKAHILCDAVYELPMVVEVTAGNVADVRKATPLLQQARLAYDFKPKYVLCDAGYSSDPLRHTIKYQYWATPVIDPHPLHKRAVRRMEERQPDWREIYKQRTAVERINSRLKAFYRLDSIRVRGRMKVRLHAFMAAIALEARALAFPDALRRCVARAA